MKRIHEYKRQFLNVLGIIARYDAIKKMSPEQKAQVGAARSAFPAGFRRLPLTKDAMQGCRRGAATAENFFLFSFLSFLCLFIIQAASAPRQ